MGKRVQAYEYFELRGGRAVRYVFYVFGEKGKESEYKLSLGSYELTTAVAREQGTIGRDERLFQLDGHYPDGEHWTFGFFEEEPSYEETRLRVVQILNGKLKPHSGFKPRKDGGGDISVDVERAD